MGAATPVALAQCRAPHRSRRSWRAVGAGHLMNTCRPPSADGLVLISSSVRVPPAVLMLCLLCSSKRPWSSSQECFSKRPRWFRFESRTSAANHRSQPLCMSVCAQSEYSIGIQKSRHLFSLQKSHSKLIRRRDQLSILNAAYLADDTQRCRLERCGAMDDYFLVNASASPVCGGAMGTM